MHLPTLLLAEDSEDDVFFMQRALKMAGVANPLCVVRDGQAAIDYLSGAGEYSDRRSFPIPHLLLLDLKMPHHSGLEVLEWIRKHSLLKTLVVLILTTSRENSDVNRAYALGVNSYLVKPPDLNQLCTLMVLIKNYWLQNPLLVFGH